MKLAEANAARDQADALKIELEARDKEISDLNNQLAAARAQTGRTRIKYVESKTNPFPAVTLSGDLAVDRQRICSGLAEVGIPANKAGDHRKSSSWRLRHCGRE